MIGILDLIGVFKSVLSTVTISPPGLQEWSVRVSGYASVNIMVTHPVGRLSVGGRAAARLVAIDIVGAGNIVGLCVYLIDSMKDRYM